MLPDIAYYLFMNEIPYESYMNEIALKNIHQYDFVGFVERVFFGS